MLLQYCTNTKQLSKPHRVVVDYDATLNPATTIMFCKIHEQHFRTLIFQNDGTVIKTNQTPNALIKQLIAPHSDLGGIIIDGIIYHLYNVHHPGTRQLPIMGKDFLIFPAIGTSRKAAGSFLINIRSAKKTNPILQLTFLNIILNFI